MIRGAAQPHPHRAPAPDAVRAEPCVVAPLHRPVGGVRAWARAARIHQWPKNLLVFAAPLAAGALGRVHALERVSVAFAALCLLASGAYLLNDVHDAPEDRRHPIKRHRPVASGAVAPGHAAVGGLVSVLLGIAVAMTLGAAVGAVAVAYAALNVAYTCALRRIAIADICAVAGAFLLRALAGGLAAQVPNSRWFIVVVSFAALFVAAGKRYADFLDPAARRSRAVLDQYTAEFLRLVLAVAAAVSLGAYCLWAFSTPTSTPVPWRAITIVPFTVAMLRYGLLVSGGAAGAPEEILFGDRFMQLMGAVWVTTLVLGL